MNTYWGLIIILRICFSLLFISWGLSWLQKIQPIGKPEAYGKSVIHATTCNFIGSRKYGKTYTSTKSTRRINQRNIQRDKLVIVIKKVWKRYWILIRGGIKNKQLLLIMLTRCWSVYIYGMGLQCILIIWEIFEVSEWLDKTSWEISHASGWNTCRISSSSPKGGAFNCMPNQRFPRDGYK